MIILVGGEKGGTGKTTIATNLAVWLHLGEREVLLVDADKQGSSRRWVGRRHPEPQDSQVPVKQITCVQQFDSLVATVQTMASRFDDVVIDCGGQDSTELRSAMLVAETMLVPVEPSMLAMETLGHVVELVEGARVMNPSLRSRVVLSKAPTNQRGEEIAARKALNAILPDSMSLLDTVIHDRRAFRDAVKTGRGVLELPDVKAQLEIKHLVRELVQLSRQTEAA